MKKKKKRSESSSLSTPPERTPSRNLKLDMSGCLLFILINGMKVFFFLLRFWNVQGREELLARKISDIVWIQTVLLKKDMDLPPSNPRKKRQNVYVTFTTGRVHKPHFLRWTWLLAFPPSFVLWRKGEGMGVRKYSNSHLMFSRTQQVNKSVKLYRVIYQWSVMNVLCNDPICRIFWNWKSEFYSTLSICKWGGRVVELTVG